MARVHWVRAGLSIALVAMAASQTAAQETVMLNDAHCGWDRNMDERDVRKKAGVKEGVGGHVSLLCDVVGYGDPRNCQVTTEQPQGNHLADAALLMAPKMICETGNAVGDRKRKVDLSFDFDAYLPDKDLEWRGGFDYVHLRAPYPPEGAKAGRSGAAVVRCGVSIHGLLERCKVVAEAPGGFGFGRSALLFAPGLQLTRPLKNGKAFTGATWTFKVNFGKASLYNLTKEDLVPVTPVAYWLKTPSWSDMAATFPAGIGVNGEPGWARVVYRCAFAQDGTLQACQTLNVKGNRQSVDYAARTLLPKFRMATETVDTANLQAIRVNLVINSRPDDERPAGTVITAPQWIRSLSSDKVQELFPAKAADAGLTTGRAVLDCTADQTGLMSDCKVLSEDPGGMDFGAAAVQIASVMGINPWTDDGEPAEGSHVRFALRLNRATDPAAPASAGGSR